VRKRFGSLLLLSVIAAALGVGGVYCWDFALGESPSQPAIDVVREINLGDKEVGAIVKPAFVIRNNGRAPLLIDDISARCGCLGLFVQKGSRCPEKIESLQIAPGEEETLSLHYGVSGPPGVTIVRRVEFRTNDPANPTVEIVLRVTPTSRYFAAPGEVSLGPIPVGARIEREVEIRAFDHSLPPITRVSASNDAIHAEYHPGKRLADGQPDAAGSVSVGLLRVTAQAPDTPGAVQGVISVFCEGREDPVITLAVSGRAIPLLELSPKDLVLPRVSTTGPLYTGTCVCRAAGTKSLTLAVEEAPAGLSVQVEDVPDNPSLKLVQIDASRLPRIVSTRGLTHRVALTALIEGRRIPLSLAVTLRQP
jgi:hypothetical protein